MPTTTIPPQLSTRTATTVVANGAFAIDASLGNEFNVTVNGASTMTITNGCPGSLIINFTQANGGSHSVALGSQVIYSDDITSFTASTTAGLVDVIGLRWSGTGSNYRILAVSHGSTS
jgi:hypothetical protein